MDAEVEDVIKAIEASFDVKFQGELDDNSNLDDVFRALRSRFDIAISSRCFTSIAFWRLRRAMMELLGLPKNSITPSAPIDTLIPVRRRELWHALSEASGLKLPGLEYQSSIGQAIFWVSFAPVIIVGLAGKSGRWLAAGAIAIPVTATSLFALLRPLASSIPVNIYNVGDLARFAVALNFGKLVKQIGPSRDHELTEAIRHVVGDLTGVEPHSLKAGNPRLIDVVEANNGLRSSI
jgi:hypothetical protein